MNGRQGKHGGDSAALSLLPGFRLGVALLLALVAPANQAATPAVDPVGRREQVAALGNLTQPPIVHPAADFAAEGSIRPLFFEGLPWRGKPTRVFAWLGLPAERAGKIPGVVLVHGGGGTAFKEWVKKWNAQGFAALALAVEGQTDQRHDQSKGKDNPQGWLRHAHGGPARHGTYGDSAEPLADQWMYHAVADVVLANSLLRSLPEVDPARVGVCGISWGGVITATVVGIDARFAFGIPIYGCGALDRAAENYVRALRDNPLYRDVWEPLLHLPRATMPLLWLTGPRDAHFPLDVQQASYRAAPGPRMVAVPFDMKHGHGPGWNPPDSYAFAKAVVETGRPWAREVTQALRDGTARVEFESARAVRGATLVGQRGADWEQTPATLASAGGRVTATAALPAGTTAYYFNLDAGGPTLSSELQSLPPQGVSPLVATPARPPASPWRGTSDQRTDPVFPGFSWDRVPLNIHFGKRTGDLTDAEIAFLARSSRFIVLEKSHGAAVHGSTEAGIADTARRIKALNPAARVFFYLNAFINWPGYSSFATYREEWTLRDAAGKIVTHPSGTPRPDPSIPEFRAWWSEAVAAQVRGGPLDGVFADAFPQALTPALAKTLGEAKARAVIAGLREMMALTKRKLGPEKQVLANGIRAGSYLELLDWEGIDGVMIEHFGAFKADAPADLKADLDAIALAAAKGKFVVVKGWPGFNWLDGDLMKRPYAELLALARERITFPLACFLIGAQPGSHFCYSWGYTDRHGMLDPYPEFDRPLGPPQAGAVWQGLSATREFARASVWIDLATHQARIDWR
jgi:dienelactone hydrolase